MVIPLIITYVILKRKNIYKYLNLFSGFSLMFSFAGLMSANYYDIGYFKYRGNIYDLETLFIIYYYTLSIPMIAIFIISLSFWIYKIAVMNR